MPKVNVFYNYGTLPHNRKKSNLLVQFLLQCHGLVPLSVYYMDNCIDKEMLNYFKHICICAYSVIEEVIVMLKETDNFNIKDF